MVNEIIEETAEEVEEDYLQEFQGYLYKSGHLYERTYKYEKDNDSGNNYAMLFEINEDYIGTALELSITENKELPKYRLRYQYDGSDTIEDFYFEKFLDLNNFLKTNPFYNLLIKAFGG